MRLDYTIAVPTNFVLTSAPVSPASMEQSSTFNFDSLSSIPDMLPSNLYAEKNGLAVGGGVNFLKRCFIPFYASKQDRKVSEFFVRHFQSFFKNGSAAVDEVKARSVISLAEQHIARHSGSSEDIARLEHYVLAARERLNTFMPQAPKETLINNCRSDNSKLLARWNKLGFAEEAFWSAPDLVDFVFKAHLHRYITHPYNNHTISVHNCLTRRNGQLTMVREPHLYMGGRYTNWSEIRNKLQIDKELRLYSIENGQKKHWVYLDRGFTQYDKYDVTHPRPLCHLDRPPLRNRVEVVTTHAHKKDWHIADRMLEGARHSLLRIVPGEGFAERHPEAGLADGGVYSIGWGTRPPEEGWGPRSEDFSFFGPFSTLRGGWSCPDLYEHLNQDLWITPVEISDADVIGLLNTIKKRGREVSHFNIVTSNCTAAMVEVLRESGIVNIPAEQPMARVWYEILLPKWTRNPIDAFGRSIARATPAILKKGITKIAALVHSIVFAPFFLLMGAWQKRISYQDECEDQNERMRRIDESKRIKPLFSTVLDVFNPDKMMFSVSKNVFEWQRIQSGSYCEEKN